MQRIKIEAFRNVGVSEDGLTIEMDASTQDGGHLELEASYMHLDWLLYALIIATGAGRERQIQTGRLSRLVPIGSKVIADDVRILPDIKNKSVLMQVTGRPHPDEPIELQAFEVNEQMLRKLSTSLLEILVQFGPKQ